MNQISIPASKVAELLAISERHVRKLNSEGRIPRPISLGRCVRWSVEELSRWQTAGAPVREVWEKMKKANLDPVLFGLSDEDYELLAKNFAQIRAYVIKQTLIINQYKDYYESPKTDK